MHSYKTVFHNRMAKLKQIFLLLVLVIVPVFSFEREEKAPKTVDWCSQINNVEQLEETIQAKEIISPVDYDDVEACTKRDLIRVCPKTNSVKESQLSHNRDHDVRCFLMCVFPTEEGDSVSQQLRISGEWEPNMVEALDTLLWHPHENPKAEARRRGLLEKGLFVDGGAYLGFYSLLAASHGQHVVAFEPIQRQRELFRRSVVANGFQEFITIYPDALSDQRKRRGSFEMRQSHNNLGGSWIRPDTWFDNHPMVASHRQVNDLLGVSSVRLDEVLRRPDNTGFRLVSCLKLDVEGYAGRALAGAAGLLAENKIKFLQLEATPLVEAAHGCDFKKLMRGLFQRGFVLCQIDRPVCESSPANNNDNSVEQMVKGALSIRHQHGSEFGFIDLILVHSPSWARQLASKVTPPLHL